MHNTRCVRADLYDSEFSPPDNGITDTEREFDTLSPEVSFLYDIEVHVARSAIPLTSWSDIVGCMEEHDLSRTGCRVLIGYRVRNSVGH